MKSNLGLSNQPFFHTDLGESLTKCKDWPQGKAACLGLSSRGKALYDPYRNIFSLQNQI